MAIDVLGRMNKCNARPFLKWVGGKRQIMPEIRESIPDFSGRYFEPFLGGGAVFFDQMPSEAVLSDNNQELIDCYKSIRDNVDDVIAVLSKHVYDQDYYYKIRARNPAKMTEIRRAARMIFLNKAGFNGLYRVNSKGTFNVPFGRHKNPTLCDAETMHACSRALKGKTITCCSFENVLKKSRKGDFVYFDPPYIPLTSTANFTAYQRRGFGMENQEQLAQVFDSLTDKGVFALLSNSDVPWMHERYADYNVRVIKARRNVNRNAAGRGHVGEILVTNY